MRERPQIDYTARDWYAINKALEAYIQARFPEWTDFDAANVGNVFKELVAYVGDGLHYQLDALVNELYIGTARNYSSLVDIAELLDYRPRPRLAAMVPVRFSLPDGPAAADVIIPAGTQLWTENPPMVYEVQDDVLIRAGEWYAYGIAKHARTVTETFNFSQAVPWREVVLSAPDFLAPGDTPNHGRLRVVINGVEWERLESILDARTGQPAYEVRVGGDGRGRLRFGDGINGAMWTGEMIVTYEAGGGRVGNVLPGSITRIGGSIVDVRGRPVNVAVRNEEAGQGGDDPEDADTIRRHAPRASRANMRSVHNEDFEAHAELVPGVLRAKAATANEDPSIPENTQRVYIVPQGGGAPSPELLARLEAMFREERPALSTVKVEIVGATYRPFDVTGRIRVEWDADPEAVRQAAEDAVRSWFDLRAVDPVTGRYLFDWGKEVWLSQIIAVIQSVPGVRSVHLTSPAADVVPATWELPMLGAVSLQVIE